MMNDGENKKLKIVTIHQPDFIPWLGFFERWKKSDIFIILDDVQFLRRGWHHRDKIKTSEGAKWLTVPVTKKNKYNQLIKNVLIDNSSDWRGKHLRTIEHNYKKAPYYDYYFNEISKIYNKNHEKLIDLNMDFLGFIADEFKIKSPTRASSEYKINSSSTQRLLDLVLAVNGNIYLTGSGSQDYLEEKIFKNNDIQVQWQKYEQTVYPQLHGVFIPMLSTIDYLMMKGSTWK